MIRWVISSLIAGTPRAVQRVAGEPERVRLVEPHARLGAGKGAAREETDPVQHRRAGVGLDERVAVIDLGTLGHAAEQPAGPVVGQQRGGIIDELAMHIVPRHRGGDPVEVDGRHTAGRSIRAAVASFIHFIPVVD